MVASSAGAISAPLLNCRFRLGLFLVRIWLRKDCALFIFPVPVRLNLLAAPRFVFNFGNLSLQLVVYAFLGAITITICLPSNEGICSTTP